MNFDAADSFWLIEHFARAAERMNDFERRLRADERFSGHEVSSGADIRFYQSGAKLEKWVELEIDANEGRTFCWWLETSRVPGGILVSAHVSISNDEFFLSYPDLPAATGAQIESALGNALAWLEKQAPPFNGKYRS